jgi:hypothetical protein
VTNYLFILDIMAVQELVRLPDALKQCLLQLWVSDERSEPLREPCRDVIGGIALDQERDHSLLISDDLRHRGEQFREDCRVSGVVPLVLGALVEGERDCDVPPSDEFGD